MSQENFHRSTNQHVLGNIHFSVVISKMKIEGKQRETGFHIGEKFIVEWNSDGRTHDKAAEILQ